MSAYFEGNSQSNKTYMEDCFDIPMFSLDSYVTVSVENNGKEEIFKIKASDVVLGDRILTNKGLSTVCYRVEILFHTNLYDVDGFTLTPEQPVINNNIINKACSLSDKTIKAKQKMCNFILTNGGFIELYNSEYDENKILVGCFNYETKEEYSYFGSSNVAAGFLICQSFQISLKSSDFIINDTFKKIIGLAPGFGFRFSDSIIFNSPMIGNLLEQKHGDLGKEKRNDKTIFIRPIQDRTNSF